VFKTRCRAGGAPSKRRAAGTIRSAFTPSRFRNDARALAGLLSEEDGELESHGVTRHPVSGRGQPPGWFILRGRRATRTPRCQPRIA
jgi:hypothetical protein